MDPEKRVPNEKRVRKPSPAVAASHRRFLFLFIPLFVLFLITGLLSKDRAFSAEENRSLAEKPELTISAVADGTYFTNLTTYHSDQFVMRDTWMRWLFQAKRWMGQKEFGEVILGSDHYLMAKPTIPDSHTVSLTCKRIRDFCRQNDQLSVYMLLAPGASSVLTDKVPEGLPIRNQIADIRTVEDYLSSNLTVIDAVSALTEHKSEKIYYKTDHHWTCLGAYYAFQAAASTMDLPATENYNIYTVTNEFRGTQASQSGGHLALDSIQVYEPLDVENHYAVFYPDSKERSSSVYVSSALEEKDKYTVFSGGNHALIQISTTNQNGRKLLILKDSYANCFLQFLTPYFEQIDVVDPRYYYENLGTLLRTDGITDVLLLYSANTFLEDTTLGDVLNTALS